jgi:hypothetical protein
MIRLIRNDTERIHFSAALLSYAMLVQFVLSASSRADFVERHLGTDAARELFAAVLIGGMWWISVQRLCAAARRDREAHIDQLTLIGAAVVIGCSWIMLLMHRFLLLDAHQTKHLMPVSWLRHLPRILAGAKQLVAYGAGALLMLIWSSLSQAAIYYASTPASFASHSLAFRAARRPSSSLSGDCDWKIIRTRTVWTKRSDDDVGWTGTPSRRWSRSTWPV